MPIPGAAYTFLVLCGIAHADAYMAFVTDAHHPQYSLYPVRLVGDVRLGPVTRRWRDEYCGACQTTRQFVELRYTCGDHDYCRGCVRDGSALAHCALHGGESFSWLKGEHDRLVWRGN